MLDRNKYTIPLYMIQYLLHSIYPMLDKSVELYTNAIIAILHHSVQIYRSL